MTDYNDLIRELMEWCGGQPGLAHRAADAIKELVAERDEAERLAFDIDGSRRLLEGRLALAEADLAAAYAALRDFGAASIYVAATWTEAYPEHVNVIAAARAWKGGE